MLTANIKHAKICAFCKYWYDPANTAIAPKSVVGGFWEYDETVWNVCKKFGAKKRSGNGCQNYEQKPL